MYAKCCSFGKQVCKRWKLGRRSERGQEENWWPQLFRDNRQNKTSFRSIHFRHFYKPAWVDAQHAALDMGTGGFTSDKSLQDDPDARMPAGDDWGVTAVEGEGRRQEHLWRQFFGNPTLWRDNRQNKKSLHGPDFWHKQSQEVLWLNNLYKPAWVDAQLAVLDMGMGRCVSVKSSPNDPDPRRPVGDNRFVTADTVSKLCHEGHLTQAVDALEVLVQTDRCISKSLLYTVLTKCVVKGDLFLGSRIHAFTVKMGYQSDAFLCNHILRMYASHGRLQDAMDVFDAVAEPNTFMWSSIISVHVKHRQDKQGIQLYHRMRRSSVKPDGHVFVAALQACARGSDLKSGQQVHADVLASGFQSNLFVCNCLVDMYAKCGSLQNALAVFDRLGKKDVVTWNAMIAGYSQQGMGEKALHLYSAMQEEGIAEPSSVTFVSLLQACASVGTTAVEKGKQLHVQIGKRGLEADLVVGCSLVNMYAKCGSLEDAQSVFDRLPQKNVVTWTAMIAGYSQQGRGKEALHLYSAMQEEGIAAPNCVTFVCLLQACASVAALPLGKQLHAQVEEQGLQGDLVVGNNLVNMYAKCGSMVDAQQVFDALSEKDVVAWGALIAGYSCQGESDVVFSLFQRMTEDDIQPNSIIFSSVLTVCSHAGLVNKGQEYFEAMSRHHGITPTLDHYACMVDLLGRAGQLDEALEVVMTMPIQPNDVVWHALLGGCRKWSNVEMGRHAFDEAVKLDGKDASAYVMMWNIYTGAQMWEEAQEIQARRMKMRAWKQPGESWWTDGSGRVHSFLVGDKEHPQSQDVYM